MRPSPFRSPKLAVAVLGFFAGAAGFTSVPASAASISTRPATELGATAGKLEIKGETIELALETAVQLALERNLALLAQRYEVSQADQAAASERGIYDLGLSADTAFSDSTQPSTSALEGAQVLTAESSNFDLSLRQLVPLGGAVSLDLENSRQDTNNLFVNPNPQYGAGVRLRFSQPLLRGFGTEPTERRLRLARLDAEISREAFELQVIDTIQRVENAYWELVRARKQLEVSQQSLDLARELHDRNRIRVEVGTLAPFELVQSEAGIARREGDIIRNQADVGDAEDSLRRLLNLEPGRLWNLELVPVTEAGVEAMQIDVEAAIAGALGRRPEIQRQKRQLDRLAVDASFFKNQLLPQLDLAVTYGSRGVAGTIFEQDGRGRRTDVVLASGDWADAFDDAIAARFDGWTIGFTFGIPLQNSTAKAQKAIADLTLEQGGVSLADLEQQIATEVRSAARLVTAAAREVDAARSSRGAQEKSLEAERKRFENGMSTSFQVLEIQEDLSLAQSTEVQAETTFRVRLAEYYRAIGSLIEQQKIEIVDEAP